MGWHREAQPGYNPRAASPPRLRQNRTPKLTLVSAQQQGAPRGADGRGGARAQAHRKPAREGPGGTSPPPHPTIADLPPAHRTLGGCTTERDSPAGHAQWGGGWRPVLGGYSWRVPARRGLDQEALVWWRGLESATIRSFEVGEPTDTRQEGALRGGTRRSPGEGAARVQQGDPRARTSFIASLAEQHSLHTHRQRRVELGVRECQGSPLRPSFEGFLISSMLAALARPIRSGGGQFRKEATPPTSPSSTPGGSRSGQTAVRRSGATAQRRNGATAVRSPPPADLQSLRLTMDGSKAGSQSRARARAPLPHASPQLPPTQAHSTPSSPWRAGSPRRAPPGPAPARLFPSRWRWRAESA